MLAKTQKTGILGLCRGGRNTGQQRQPSVPVQGDRERVSPQGPSPGVHGSTHTAQKGKRSKGGSAQDRTDKTGGTATPRNADTGCNMHEPRKHSAT